MFPNIDPLLSTTARIITSNAVTMVTNQGTDASTNSAETCVNGWEKCLDGTCEPFHWLCTEHDGAPHFTTRTPQETTPTTSSMTLVTRTPGSTPTTTPTLTTTTASAPVTSNNGQCPSGFIVCDDGTCEPFETNCAETGLAMVSFETKDPMVSTTTSSPSSNTVAMATNQGTMSVSTMIQTMLPGGTNMAMVTGSAPTSPPAIASNGQCPSGFIVCNDGTCEPFESNCAETGLATGTFPTMDPLLSTTTRDPSSNAVTMATNQGTMSTSTTTQTIPTTTTTMAIVTDSNGNEVCSDGWEVCKDGTCEPFHWLCMEHDVALVG